MNILTLILIPLVASVLVPMLDKKMGKALALVATLLNLIVSGIFLAQFKLTSDYQFAVMYPWIKSIGAQFHLGIDGINLIPILMTNFLMPIIITAISKQHSKGHIFCALALLMQAALIGVFSALDGLLFYLFWELALIPIYLIVLLWGDENRQKVVVKFFIYTLLGSLFMLASLIYLYVHADTPSFALDSLYNNNLSTNEQFWVGLGLLSAFLIKIPIVPFHTWQASTYTTAPTAGTMLLSGIMLKMGLYGLIRWFVPIVPLALSRLMPVLVILAIIGIVYGAIIALTQKNLKTLLAFSSLSHVGLIAAGIFVWNQDGLNGALIQMLNHGIIIVGLFYIVDMIHHRTGTYNLPELGGLRNQAPQLASFFLLFILASVALPLTNGFIGEFLLLNGLFQHHFWAAIVGGTTIILGAAYMFRMYQKSMLGLDYQYHYSIPDIGWKEKTVLVPIALAIIVLGLYPQYLLDLIEPSVTNLFSLINSAH